MISTTRYLDSFSENHLDVLKLGSRSGLLWHNNDRTLAGIGCAKKICLDRPVGTAAAQSELAALLGVNKVSGDDGAVPGTGPLAFAALPFDREAAGELIVPEIVVGIDGARRHWVTLVQDGEATSADFAKAVERIRSQLERSVPATADATTMTLRSVLPPEQWSAIVGEAVRRINSGQLNKAVLAREIVLECDQPIDPAMVLDHLRSTFATAILFNIDGFVGASPEMLAARTFDVVEAHPLAGTAPRGADPVTDDKLAADLLASTKDQWEHRVTIGWLLNTLLPFCSYVDAEPEPSIVTLANVHHLGTKVEGRLSAPAASILELVAALHPTPAVGGDPQDKSLDLIAEIEKADRDLYAGPVGWVDGAGNGAFAVGIRSATITGNTARIFSGVGVVGDSDPASELAETRSKLQAMLGALIRP